MVVSLFKVLVDIHAYVAKLIKENIVKRETDAFPCRVEMVVIVSIAKHIIYASARKDSRESIATLRTSVTIGFVKMVEHVCK